MLLDTHAVVWALTSPRKLSEYPRDVIGSTDNTIVVSIASVWEISIKVGLGKWPEAAETLEKFEEVMLKAGYSHLAITVAHARAAGLIVSPHRDPFDRLLAAQARIEGMAVVSADPRIAALGVQVIW